MVDDAHGICTFDKLVMLGSFKNMVILKFKEFQSINEVEKYKTAELYVDRKDAVDLEEDEYFICDLIGLKVIDDENQEIGILTDVLQSSANDVYEITDANNNKFLFPAIKQCILKVDMNTKTVYVHVMKGLMDL